jgi:hypothetical protein
MNLAEQRTSETSSTGVPAPRQGAPGRTRITVEKEVDADTAARFWTLYQQTFGDLATRAVARQLLHEHEFMAEMLDHRVDKYLAWDEAGTAVGMCTFTNHLETVPWISPDYFRHHYPEHAARGALYYLGFILVSHDRRRTRLFSEMITEVVQVLIADRAVCGYDVCKFNNEVIHLGDAIETLLHRIADVEVEVVDTQTYYRALFAGTPPTPQVGRQGNGQLPRMRNASAT